MILSEEQQKAFVQRYIDRYKVEKAIEYTSEELLGISNEEDKEQRQVYIKDLLGKKANQTYKNRARGKETMFNKVFNTLWLCY
jgi:hypothetical protein